MGFASLPAEALEEIFRYCLLDPDSDSYAALALTCRKAHQAGSLYLQYRKRFRKFRYNVPAEAELQDWGQFGSGYENPLTATIYNALDLLQVIAATPLIATLIREPDFSDDSLRDEGDVPEDLMPGDTTALLALLKDSPYLAAQSYDPEEWLAKMRTEFEGHADMFLLTLLPNLRRFVSSHRQAYTRCDSRYSDWTDKLLASLVHCANHPSPSRNALSKLEYVGVHHEYPGATTRFCPDNLLPLIGIQTVVSFHADGMVIDENGDFEMETLAPDDEPSNIRSLQIIESVFDWNSARKCLAHTKKLERFILTWDVKWSGVGSDFNAGACLAYIQDAVGDTLQELCIVDLGSNPYWGATLTDMTRFKRLRALALSFDALCGPAFEYDNEDNDEPQNLVGDHAAPRLVDMLPASIEHVHLRIYSPYIQDAEAVGKILRFSGQERREKLPLWKLLAFDTSEGYVDMAADVARAFVAEMKDEDPDFTMTMTTGDTLGSWIRR